MKKQLLSCILIVILVIISQQLAAQVKIEKLQADTSEYPYWFQMMQDPDANYRATQSAFEKYWTGKNNYKGNGWKVFKRWEYITRDLVQPNGKLLAPDHIYNEYTKFKSKNASKAVTTSTWSLVGPTVLPTNGTFPSQPNGMGRVNALAFHPTNPNIIFLGTPSGGIWKTQDAGITWNTISSNLPTLGVSSIIIHPTDPNTMWVGTGDRDGGHYGDAPGMGVFMTTNGGVSWVASNIGMGNVTVGMMIIHPTDFNIILAATSTGIFKSTNGGINWLKTSSNSFNYKDIKFNPGQPNIVYAATNDGNFYRSINSGDSFTNILSGLPNLGRTVIGVSMSSPNIVYLCQNENTVFIGLLRSTDWGETFTTQSTSPNIMSRECDASGSDGQASYNLCIAVDPNNADIIYIGGVNIWKSTNAGVSWNIKAFWNPPWLGACSLVPAVHADHHCLNFSPVNGTLYNGNDGGIYFTANGGNSWTDISAGLSISQIYRIGQSSLTNNMLLSGCQDNGAIYSEGNSFTTIMGGDCMECVIDYSDNDYKYISGLYGEIRRYTAGSGYEAIAGLNVNGIDEDGDWVTPFILDNNDPNTMFVGYNNVWRSNNVKTSVSWTKISEFPGNNGIVLEQSPANNAILYVVTGWTDTGGAGQTNKLYRTDNANATIPGTVTWTVCTLPAGNNLITDLEAHPTDSYIVYATTKIGVFKSIDKGVSWTEIGNFPDTYPRCIVYDKNSNEGLYVGDRASVWYKDATMADWVLYNEGLPFTTITELEIFYDNANPANNKIKAATYGRGLWECDLFTAAPQLASLTTTVVSNITQTSAVSGGNITSAGSSPVTARGVCWSTSQTPTITGNHTTDGTGIGTFSSTIAGLVTNTNYYVRAYAINSVGTSYGNQVSFTTLSAFSCGSSITISHIAGTVAPVNKMVIYGTVTNIPGEVTKCWITSNLGSDHQATAVNDATEASAGWYWQFNRKQGYKHTATVVTPSWTITSINENSDWTLANDPCTIELGSGWRIPTYVEWYNVDNTGNWTNWNGPWNSGLKLHATGYVHHSIGSLYNRGSYGYYWSSTQINSLIGWHLYFYSGTSFMYDYNYKVLGFSLRCINDNCASFLPVSVSIVATANPVSTGTSVTFTANPTNGGSPLYLWKVNGTNIGTNTNTCTYTPANNDVITCTITSSLTCVSNNPATSNAINIIVTASGAACSGIPTITYGGKTYNTVQIGTQCWMKENLNIGTRINGIQNPTNDGVIEKYCYGDIESNCDVYGGLYQWNEMMLYISTQGAQGICPSGWHVPSDAEWCQLTTCLDATVNCNTTGFSGTNAGGKLKESGTSHWTTPNTGGTNTSGFTALPNGYRAFNGLFYDLQNKGHFQSSTETGTTYAWYRSFYYNSAQVWRQYDSRKDQAFSVRCLKDQSVLTTQSFQNITVLNSQSNCYNATQTINVAGSGTTFTVQSEGSSTMIAGQNIKYMPTTTVQSGGYMWGYIAPTGPWCVTPSMLAVALAEDEIPRSIQQSHFKVYPNPTTGNFILELIGDADQVKVDIYGIWGDKILSTSINGERKHEFSLSDKPVGVYFIRVISEDKAETVKIIKQ